MIKKTKEEVIEKEIETPCEEPVINQELAELYEILSGMKKYGITRISDIENRIAKFL